MDRISRTAFRTHLAAEALILIDDVDHQVLTYVSRTLLVHYMSDILIAEMRKRGVDGVSRSLSESAE